MNKPKEPMGHIAKTFLPSTLPIPDYDDDNIYSKTPSMMSPIHSEKSPKFSDAKTPKGRYIDLTTPSPPKHSRPDSQKLSLSINFGKPINPTFPGSPML
jgi:hypothetical protein